MNHKLLLLQRLASYTAILAIGFIGVSATNSAIAQPALEMKSAIQMAQVPSIQGSWRLANMVESPFPTPMVPAGDLTVDFANDSVSGFGGCNRFSGNYKITGNQLTIGPLASTFKACEPPIMQQESKFLTALQGAQRYEVNAQGLQIYYKTDKTSGVMRFISRAVPALW